MTSLTNCKLIIDTRERNVTRHASELAETTHSIKQITVGDYAIVSPTGHILVVIERKSLEDFSASLKDGRSANKSKLIDLRAQTGCRIVYIIEGPEFPDPNTCFGNIPYRYIESSIFHLMVRDGVTILRTRDSLDTARALARFVASMDSLCKKDFKDEELVCLDAEVVPIGGADLAQPIPADALLTRKHTKSDHDIVRELWSCFPGISMETASEYMHNWSIADVICGRIGPALAGFKLASGRKLNKRVISSLSIVPGNIQVRLLSSIPGIAHSSAADIMKVGNLRSLLSWGVGDLAMIPIGKAGRRLGAKTAERLLMYFNYKCAGADNPEN